MPMPARPEIVTTRTPLDKVSALATWVALLTLVLEFGFYAPIVDVRLLHLLQVLAVVLHMVCITHGLLRPNGTRERSHGWSPPIHRGTEPVVPTHHTLYPASPQASRRGDPEGRAEKHSMTLLFDGALVFAAVIVLMVDFHAAWNAVLKTWVIYLVALRTFEILRRVIIAISSWSADSSALKFGRMILLSYLATIVLGGLALSLPRAMSREHAADDAFYLAKRTMNSFFTSTSAVCGTGLTVYDIGRDYTRFGQTVILLLVQIGGLQTMIVGSLIVLGIDYRFHTQHLFVPDEFQRHGSAVGGLRMIRTIIVTVLAIELVGAAFLYSSNPLEIAEGLDRLFSSAFHTVFAFCNSGFTLYDAGMASWHASWRLYGVMMPLVVLGGIGYPVLVDIGRWFRSRVRNPSVSSVAHVRLSGYSKWILACTALLILVPTVMLLLFESVGEPPSATTPAQPTMNRLPPADRAAAALFHVVSSRSAGFQTVALDRDSLTLASHALLEMLMFIGAAPASTAGGTTIIAIPLFVLAVRNIRGRYWAPQSRDGKLNRSVAMMVLSMVALVLVGTVSILLTDAVAGVREALFEVVSALSGSGLTTGLTPRLTYDGRAVLTALMFLGRTVPMLWLLFGVASTQQRSAARCNGRHYNG